MLARNSLFDAALPSMSTETSVFANSMSRALASFASSARFHAFSRASMRPPSSLMLVCCACVIPCCASAVISISTIAPPAIIDLFITLPPSTSFSVCRMFALSAVFSSRVGYPLLPPYIFRSQSFGSCTSECRRRNSSHAVAFPPKFVYNASHAQGRLGPRHQPRRLHRPPRWIGRFSLHAQGLLSLPPPRRPRGHRKHLSFSWTSNQFHRLEPSCRLELPQSKVRS